MMITSDPVTPVRPLGAKVTLTCTVNLNPAVDVPVAVNVQLSDPARSPLTTTTPSMSGSTYTSTAMVSSFGREQSGVYNCTATITSNVTQSESTGSTTARITVGKCNTHSDCYSINTYSN